MQGVSLLTKARRRPVDLFELAVTYDGIEIRRPGESARHLSWDRVSEWEIEQRRDGVLLTLRGGGSVTPLVIPRWSVDELDVVLRQVTSQPPPDDQPAAPAAKTPTPPAAAKAPVVTPPASKPNVAPTPEPEVTPKASTPVAAALAAAVPAVAIPVELAQALDLEPEPPLEATFEDVVSQHLAPRRPAPAEPVASEEPQLTSGLVWPQESTLGPVVERPTLSWPAGAGEADADPPTHEFRLPAVPGRAPGAMDGAMAPMKTDLTFNDDLAVADLVTEDAVDALLAPPSAPAPTAANRVPSATPTTAKTATTPAVREPALPTPPPIFIPPREGAPDPVLAPTRAERRRTERRSRVRPEPAPREPRPQPVREPAVREPKPARAPRPRSALVRAASTVVLLAAAALAVSLVLAQSAGWIHLPYLGLPG
jgi:hypothetical protein